MSEPNFVVDIHCHTFNASDLSVKGYLRNVQFNVDESPSFLAGGVINRLVAYASSAPMAIDEHKYITELGYGGDLRRSGAAVDLQSAPDTTPQDFARHLLELRYATSPEDAEIFGDIVGAMREAKERKALPAWAELAWLQVERDAPELRRRRGPSWNPLVLYGWISRLRKYRFEIIQEIDNLYGRDHRGTVDLFVTAMVDYAMWLGDHPRTSIPEQIVLMDRLTRLFEGRIHAYVPFDPWRQVAMERSAITPLDWVKDAVTKHGFVGVKLYPPMGFRPALNEISGGFEAVYPGDSRGFGAKLDAALDELFDWCCRNDVPILTHCADSNESKQNYGLRAGPAFWEAALSRHRDLRLNLGHFGGFDTLRKGRGHWAWEIARLMESYPNVYADVGYWSDARSRELHGDLRAALEGLFGEFPTARDRLMYGSDWQMVALQDWAENYLVDFQDGVSSLGDSFGKNFFGENALRFLGITSSEKQRTRLAQFWGDRLPPWMAMAELAKSVPAAADSGGAGARKSADWSFLAYIAGDNNLSDAGLADIQEMCKVGAPRDSYVAVQIDTAGEFEGSVRYEIPEKEPGDDKAYRKVIERLKEGDSGDPDTLREFLAWGLGRYPAAKTVAVVWNHGSGFRSVRRDIAYDDKGSSIDIPELKRALSMAREKNGSRKLTILGFDACLMAMLEIAHHLRDEAEFIVGSQQTEPGDGWPYHDVLQQMAGAADGRTLAKDIVSAYIQSYKRSRTQDVTQSAIDCSHIVGAAKALGKLGDALSDALPMIEPVMQVVRTEVQSFDYADYIDIYHFAKLLKDQLAGLAPIITAADAMLTTYGKVVVASDKNGRSVKDAQGLTVWFPAERSVYLAHRNKYKGLDCVADKEPGAPDDPDAAGWARFLDAFFLGRVPAPTPVVTTGSVN